MKNIQEYQSVGEWFKDAKREGFSFPLTMPHGIEIAMKELKKNFAEVFTLFEQEEIIIQTGKTLIYNMMGHKAIKGHE